MTSSMACNPMPQPKPTYVRNHKQNDGDVVEGVSFLLNFNLRHPSQILHENFYVVDSIDFKRNLTASLNSDKRQRLVRISMISFAVPTIRWIVVRMTWTSSITSSASHHLLPVVP